MIEQSHPPQSQKSLHLLLQQQCSPSLQQQPESQLGPPLLRGGGGVGVQPAINKAAAIKQINLMTPPWITYLVFAGA